MTPEELDEYYNTRLAQEEHERSLDKLEKGIKKVPQEQQEEVQAYIDKFSK